MYPVSSESQNTNGEVSMSSEIDRAISDPQHPIWKIILLCVLILGGGSIASDMDIISVAGI